MIQDAPPGTEIEAIDTYGESMSDQVSVEDGTVTLTRGGWWAGFRVRFPGGSIVIVPNPIRWVETPSNLQFGKLQISDA